MSLAVILEVLLALLRFPGELSAFVRLISKSDEEKRQEINKMIQDELKSFENDGRPQ